VGLVYGEQLCGPEDVPTYRLMIHSLQRILADQHLQLHLYNIRSGATGFSSDCDKLIGDLRKGILAGLVTVAWPCYEEESVELARSDRELLSLMQDSKVPFSGLGTLPGLVQVDMASLGYLGTKHFLDQGLGRVAVIGGFDSPSEPNSAIEGYRRAYSERGLAFNPEWIVCPKELSRPVGYMTVRRLWSLSDRPEAIVLTDDFVAQGAMTAILELGIRVPETLQLATFYVRGGDLFFPKPFIRLEIAPEDLARHISDRLLDMMKDPEKHREPIIYQPRVVVDTTGPEWSSRKVTPFSDVPRESRTLVAAKK
jgi:DNA-binding LacI/PurR family transcriptional regulator